MKTLENFDFGSRSSVGRSKYDWDAILNGSINVLSQGEDFDSKTFPGRVRAVAKDMGLKVRMKQRPLKDEDGNVLKDDDGNELIELILQSYKADDAEKAFAEAGEDDGEAEAEETQPRRRRRKADAAS